MSVDTWYFNNSISSLHFFFFKSPHPQRPKQKRDCFTSAQTIEVHNSRGHHHHIHIYVLLFYFSPTELVTFNIRTSLNIHLNNVTPSLCGSLSTSLGEEMPRALSDGHWRAFLLEQQFAHHRKRGAFRNTHRLHNPCQRSTPI